ncbi:phage tail length tape measure family protein [Nitrosomonas halophila]|uniref:Prophage tail length tape measure protein n=1 Tax=Nitrosomonas halophila TaxID=44576 RepID=A0A1H3FAU8_9PROT|nr:phage tail length tape measure family protein [Nitrosomonas halophila]SDX88015.1 Prophage tail length tape measure protein [Nitrosomonas halophila]
MANDLEVGVKLTADGKGLVGEARSAKEAVKGLGDETRKTGREMEQSASQTSGYVRNLSSLTSGLGSAARALSLLGASGIALAGMQLFRGMIQESDTAQRNLLRTEAIIKATGQTAGFTAEQLRNQAKELARATLQSTEGVEQAQQILLTFRSVSGDTFTRATELAADLATVTGQGLTGAMTQLGKALESPVEGINALRRSGVSFTDAQREMIKTLVETNQLADAQAMILDELSRQYGGVAKAEAMGYAGAVDTLGQAWQELKLALNDAMGVGDKAGWVFTKLAETVDWLTESLRRMSGAQALGGVQAVRTEIIKTEENLRELEKRRAGRFGFVVSQQEIDFEKAKLRELNRELAQLIRTQAELKASSNALIPARKPLIDSQEAMTKATKSQVTESQRFLAALKREVEQLGLNSIEIRRMEAARLGVLELAGPEIDALEEKTRALAEQTEAVRAHEAAQRKIEQVTQSVMTGQEKYAARVRELDGLLAKGLGQETYNRALKDAEAQFLQTSQTGQRAFSAIEQYAIQGARNIQTAFSRFFFDPFSNGLKGLVTGLGNAVRQMVAEIAAMKFARSLGLGSMLGLGSSSAFAGGGSLLDMASLGSSAYSLLNGGFGAGSLASSFATSGIGQSLGLSAKMGGSGMPFMTSAGSAFSSAASTLGAGAFGVMAGSMLAGDKQIAGINGTISSAGGAAIGAAIAGPVGAAVGGVLGGAVNAMFGRGPLKQRATTLEGTIGAQGFESGDITTAFRAKGGLFRSNKNDFARVDALTGEISTDNKKLLDYAADLARVSRDVIGLIDETVNSVGSSLNRMGEDLGLSTDTLNAFQTQIRLVSENGQFLTEQQIGEEIQRISDAMARSLVPGLDAFSRRGESALQTVTRLNAEFNVLAGLGAALGNSLNGTKAFLRSVSFEQRSAFVDAAGGIDALAIKAQFFSDNFLTEAERLQPSIERLDEEMARLGLSAEMSKRQFRDLVMSFGQAGGISQAMLQGMLNVAPLFVQVKDGLAALYPALQDTTDATYDLAAAESLIASTRSALVAAYNRERAALEGVANRFKDLATNLRSASDALSLGNLSPLTPQQRLEEARRQFNQDRLGANAGDQDALRRLPESARAFLEASQIYNASSAEYVADFNFVKSVLDSAAKVADTEAEIAKRQLLAMEASVGRLVDIDDKLGDVKSLMNELIAAVLQGPGNPAISNQAIRDFASAPGRTSDEILAAAVKHGVSGSQLSGALAVNQSVISQGSGGLSISDQQIKDFVWQNIANPRLIYDTAKEYGITLSRVASASGLPYADIEQWARQNNLPMFERGTDFVHKGGLAMLHPAEAVTPASHMRDMAQEIAELRRELAELRREQNQQTSALINVAVESQRMNAEMIIQSNQDIAGSAAWRDQAKAVMR